MKRGKRYSDINKLLSDHVNEVRRQVVRLQEAYLSTLVVVIGFPDTFFGSSFLLFQEEAHPKGLAKIKLSQRSVFVNARWSCEREKHNETCFFSLSSLTITRETCAS
jgi:hypothetical protein